MSEYFDFQPEDDEPSEAGQPAGEASSEASSEPPAHAPTDDAAAVAGGSTGWSFADDRSTDDPTPPLGTDGVGTAASAAATRRPRGAALFAAAAASIVAIALIAGSVGYLLGEPSTTTAAPRVPNGFSNPFNFSGPSGTVTGPSGASGFHFSFPGTGNGGQASTTVPKAVTSSESALVDLDSSLGGEASGAGTGIVLTSGGLVLTNNHVVDGATSLTATDLGNSQTYNATVVGYDVKDDIALVQLEGASGLATASVASPATVGEAVYAVGNAGGAGGTPTVTSGSITGTDKVVTASDAFNGTSETLNGMLSTSAALISGDSGGALTTADGQVVGVDTAGSGTRGGGFAVPIATALSIIHEIQAGVTTDRVHVGPTALLGVRIPSQSSTTGAPVSSVGAGTPAAAAGITAGSKVTSVGGIPVTDGASLRAAMTTLAPGATVRVTWTDAKGTSHAATVTLATGPPQ
jgi:S1-C subfamily serine protease